MDLSVNGFGSLPVRFFAGLWELWGNRCSKGSRLRGGSARIREDFKPQSHAQLLFLLQGLPGGRGFS